jgi:hypothetical protein
MIADFFTKPLQGGLFRKFRDVVMGITTILSLYNVESPPVIKHVGNSVNGAINVNGTSPLTVDANGQHTPRNIETGGLTSGGSSTKDTVTVGRNQSDRNNAMRDKHSH